MEGTVVRLGGSEPVRKARVRLQTIDDKSNVTTVLTNSDGHFNLTVIAAGRYRLSISRLGFVTQQYGQKKPDGPASILTLRAGQQIKDLLFRLVPAAIITGRVFDEDGDPVAATWVDALRLVYAGGKRSLQAVGRADTNDLGEYRLYGLTPGRYFVSAVVPHSDDSISSVATSGSSVEGQQGYGKLYYPGTPDSSQAAPIELKPGEETARIDIQLRPVSVYRVRGRVFNEMTHKTGIGTNLFLVPRSRPGAEQWEFMDQQVSVDKSDGIFEIPNVLPGSYSLVAFLMEGGKFYSTRIPVDVGDGDVEGISIAMTAGVDINGKITWDEPTSSAKDQLTVSCATIEVDFGTPQQAHVNSDNTFAFRSLGEGSYQLSVAGLCKDCYLKEARYGPTTSTEGHFRVAPGDPASLEINLSANGARVSGNVVDADGLPATGAWVVLVPDATRRAQFGLYEAQTSDQHGNFDLRGIPPGEYKLFSWDQVELNAWQDPEFLRPFEAKGESVTLQEGDKKTKNLTVIATTPPAQPQQ